MRASSKASLRSKASTSKPTVATAAGGERSPQPVKRRKQAVVIVHGMGEQKPLETLRGFVEAVWGAKPTPGDHAPEDDVWLVPDMRTGLKELARVTTRKHNGVATDFYELYWSDLLVGNTLAQIRGWVSGLLLRWPHQVPRETFSLWLALWAIVCVILAIAAYVGLGSPKELWKLVTETPTVQNTVTRAFSIALAMGLMLALWRKLGRDLERRGNADKTFPGIWATVTPNAASASAAFSRLLAVLLPLVIGYAAYRWFPWSLLELPRTWALLAAAFITSILAVWVVPVFGDVARYVRTSPDAVSARADIRNRGVDLLRALHGPMKPESKREYDFGDTSEYERIVVVGHSLGSIIAYDILRLFWQERGPTRLNPAPPTAFEALKELDAFCREAYEADVDLDVRTFRDHQRKVSEGLREDSDGWRVSDFVTLGSPLTHAEFLISKDRAAFEERKAERLFPTCPPTLELPDKSFLYGEKSGPKYAHHAAMFAAMRWTNIYDPGRWLLFGDFISGPCSPNFGPGVLDVPVTIWKRGLFSRLATHTHYWNPEATAKASEEAFAKLDIPYPPTDRRVHLLLLRKALALR